MFITTNALNCCFPHITDTGTSNHSPIEHLSTVESCLATQIGNLVLPNATVDLVYHCFVSSPGDLRDKENTYTRITIIQF